MFRSGSWYVWSQDVIFLIQCRLERLVWFNTSSRSFSSQVDRYAFNIVENGTSVNEQVEVDVEKQTEVIRVPQHNNVEAVEILNDFEAVSQQF